MKWRTSRTEASISVSKSFLILPRLLLSTLCLKADFSIWRLVYWRVTSHGCSIWRSGDRWLGRYRPGSPDLVHSLHHNCRRWPPVAPGAERATINVAPHPLWHVSIGYQQRFIDRKSTRLNSSH